MGVAAVAVTAFLFVAAVGWSAMLAAERKEAAREVRDAERQDDERTDRLLHSGITFDSVTYQNGPKRLTVAMTNSGDAELDADGLDLLLDGVWRTSDVYSRKVDNFDAQTWSPGTQLVILVQNVASNPARVQVTTEEGFTATR